MIETSYILKGKNRRIAALKLEVKAESIKVDIQWNLTTYKLNLNKGDIKATQGDTGHSQPDMVTQVYAHILDEDRKVNAQRFEAGFYAKPNLRGVEQSLRSESV